jgi:hypothetical protein
MGFLFSDMSAPTQPKESSERVQMSKSVPNTLAVHAYSLSLHRSFTWCILHFCAAGQICGSLHWMCLCYIFVSTDMKNLNTGCIALQI